MKGAHHGGRYQRRAFALKQAADRNPATKCWRCGLTLAQHPPHKNGRPPFWTAGHVVDGQVDGVLLPEASVCNFQAGARHGNSTRTKRTKTDLSW